MLSPSERSLAAAMISEQFGEHSCPRCKFRLATGVFEVYTEGDNHSEITHLCATCAFSVKGQLVRIHLIKTLH